MIRATLENGVTRSEWLVDAWTSAIMTYAMSPPKRKPILQGTIDTWGQARQHDISRLRIYIVGLGSVGGFVAEALTRMGLVQLTLIDPDRIEIHNLDRLIHATRSDVGKYNVEVVARRIRRIATADDFQVRACNRPIQCEGAYRLALDSDLLVCTVDRPLPKDLLNRIAHAHWIPLIFGGVFVQNKTDGTLSQVHWSVIVSGLGRRCLRCDGQYTSSDVVMEMDGSLDNPSYINTDLQTPSSPTNQNVFPLSSHLASSIVLELIRLVISDTWWPSSTDKLDYQLIQNQLIIRMMLNASLIAQSAVHRLSEISISHHSLVESLHQEIADL